MLVGSCNQPCREADSPGLRVMDRVTAMRMDWLQPLLRGRQTQTTAGQTGGRGWWSLRRRNPLTRGGTPAAPRPRCAGQPEAPIERVTISLAHHLDVARATQFLLRALDCDDWYATCRHDHQMIVLLTRRGEAQFGISYECSPGIQKAVFHDSRAWALTLIPMSSRNNLPPTKVKVIKSGLAELHTWPAS